MLKFILILYCIIPDFNYSLSIRKDIDMAKQFLKYYEIPEPDLCTGERISELCSNNDKEVCSARLSRKKMEFKQFENPCYMELNNLCESQDNIWTIKNAGPCVMNDELRRFAKEIEEKADAKSTENDANSTEATRTDDDNTDDRDETTPDDTATDENLATHETTTPDETVTIDEDVTETSPDDTTTDQAEGVVNDTTPDDTAEETNSTEDVTEALRKAEDDDADITNETGADETTTNETDIAEDVTEVLTNAEDEDDEDTTKDETVADETTTDENNTADDVTEVLRNGEEEDVDTTNDETTIAEEAVTELESTIIEDDNATEDTTLGGITTDVIKTNAVNETTNAAEIGKIMYDDGSVKTALREGRFPPMRAEKSWDRVPCAKRVKPCPNINFPVCLYYKKEIPNNITYYYFINKCEAQQYTCYHPEHRRYEYLTPESLARVINMRSEAFFITASCKIDGASSMRAGFCAHIRYINYARFFHTMSAWGHYGWLNGPWAYNHILKPHERT